MNDSTNIRVMADNIRKLEKMVKEAGSELPTPSAGDVGKVLTVNSDLGYSVDSVPREVPTPGAGDTGKIIKVGSSGYELVTDYATIDYSTTEQNTGRKWVDGKDIYRVAWSGLSPTEGYTQINVGIVDKIISIRGTHGQTNNRYYDFGYDFRSSYYDKATGTFYLIASTNEVFQNIPVELIFEFTKPDPAPTNETKKKTTKKG